jgi:hypothetical protein
LTKGDLLVKRISVVLSNMPGLLRDIVRDAISTTSDIYITSEAQSINELQALLKRQDPDLVVAADQDPEFARGARDLLSQRVLPRLLLVTQSGRDASLHWMQPRVSPLGRLTPDSLVREIRAAASLDTTWPSQGEEKT